MSNSQKSQNPVSKSSSSKMTLIGSKSGFLKPTKIRGRPKEYIPVTAMARDLRVESPMQKLFYDNCHREISPEYDINSGNITF